MALLIKNMIKGYIYLNEELADPRTINYFFMSSPVYLFSIIGLYLLFVQKWGPEFMKNRNPFNLRKIIIIYNITQILLCGFIVVQFMQKAFFQINWRCEPINYSTDYLPTEFAFYSWVYLLIKLVDLLDTVFFVLRKKNNQISFLHLYHHCGMVILSWFGTKYFAGGHGIILGFVNCIVHVFMYSYYLMSAWDDKYKKSVWWKKHITQLQISQFAFLIVSFGQILFQPQCLYPKGLVIAILPQNIFMGAMFIDFYYKAYIKTKKEQSAVGSKATAIGSNKEE